MKTKPRPGFVVKGPMAIMRGGRRDGWVYYDADLVEVERIAQDRGETLGYTRTDTFAPHPHVDATCRIWQHHRRLTHA